MARCPRCLELEDEVDTLRQRLAAVGQYVMHSPGLTPTWTASTSWRVGWRSTRLLMPRLASVPAGPAWHALWAVAWGDWECRWWRLVRENETLRSHIGVLLTEISRLRDRG